MTTRRDFIKKTVAGTAALSLGSILPGFGSSRYQDILGANEKIRIGVIGVNSRGSALAQGFAKQPDCEVTYICDVDSRALEKCQAVIHKLTGRTPKGEKDIRKMLESNEFEAVVIATPDHWHAKAAIMAMQAGKHVYLEKPTSHNPAENEMLVRATLNRSGWQSTQIIPECNQSDGGNQVRHHRKSEICQIMVCQQPSFYRNR